jgi:hypothetical protein
MYTLRVLYFILTEGDRRGRKKKMAQMKKERERRGSWVILVHRTGCLVRLHAVSYIHRQLLFQAISPRHASLKHETFSHRENPILFTFHSQGLAPMRLPTLLTRSMKSSRTPPLLNLCMTSLRTLPSAPVTSLRRTHLSTKMSLRWKRVSLKRRPVTSPRQCMRTP